MSGIALQGSPYISVGIPRNFGDRVIEKYLFNYCGDQDSVTRATNAILQLLSNDPTLCPTFATAPRQNLEEQIKRDAYLTLNGRAVSLSAEREAPGDADMNYKDRYFSEALIHQPARCSQGHIFEQSRAQAWAKKQTQCPVGNNHVMGNLDLDAELQWNINSYRENRQNQAQRELNIIQRQSMTQLHNQALALQQQRQQQQISFLQGIQSVDPWVAAAGTGKILVKAGGKKAFVALGKTFTVRLTEEGTKEAGKAFGKSMATKIPILSIFVGIGLAIYRASQGQYGRAAGEVVSGLAACVPIYGTAASITFDVALSSYDVYEAFSAHKASCVPVVSIDVERAYFVLGIDQTEHPSPSRELVDNKYKDQISLLHPDPAGPLGNYDQQELSGMTTTLNMSKQEIYKVRGWK